MTTDREAFEKKVSTEFEQPPCLDRNGDSYDDGYVDNAWWGWQACSQHHEARIKELKSVLADLDASINKYGECEADSKLQERVTKVLTDKG